MSSRSRTHGSAELLALLCAAGAIGLLTFIFGFWLALQDDTIAALSFVLVVLMAATVSTLRVAVAASVFAVVCFNFFFLRPVNSLDIIDPENWVAMIALLTVSVVASHLSTQARRRALDATARRDELARLLEERDTAEALRRGAELKSALLASLSHDLMTPLTAATIAANNLKTSWLSDEQRREQADLVRVELERLNRLFAHMRDMATIETNAVAVEREWIAPAEIVEAAACQVDPQFTDYQLDIDATTEQLLVRLDPRVTSTALTHLLENARQYSPAGSLITVAVRQTAGELQIAVSDCGAGIPAEDLEYIFERFYRSASAAQQRFGTGMGLAIARGLLAAEGGRIWATNRAEGGAVFTMAVPVEARAATVLAEGI